MFAGEHFFNDPSFPFCGGGVWIGDPTDVPPAKRPDALLCSTNTSDQVTQREVSAEVPLRGSFVRVGAGAQCPPQLCRRCQAEVSGASPPECEATPLPLSREAMWGEPPRVGVSKGSQQRPQGFPVRFTHRGDRVRPLPLGSS